MHWTSSASAKDSNTPLRELFKLWVKKRGAPAQSSVGGLQLSAVIQQVLYSVSVRTRTVFSFSQHPVSEPFSRNHSDPASQHSRIRYVDLITDCAMPYRRSSPHLTPQPCESCKGAWTSL